jgi:hypothetical protein
MTCLSSPATTGNRRQRPAWPLQNRERLRDGREQLDDAMQRFRRLFKVVHE